MAPRLVWLDVCTSEDFQARLLEFRPPLTRRRLLAAIAKKIPGISKQSRLYRSTGEEITDEVQADLAEGMLLVVSHGTWEPEEGFRIQKAEAEADFRPPLREVVAEKSIGSAPKSRGESLTQCLSDDLLVKLSSYLAAVSLLRCGCSCRLWLDRTLACTKLWKGLCEDLLGLALLKLHQRAWATLGSSTDASFFRSLVRAASKCESFAYDPALRQGCIRNLQEQHCSLPDREQQILKYHLCASGHSAVTLQNLVVIIGGWRKRRPERDLHLYVVDMSADGGPCLRQPILTANSARPERRLRHASCVVQPSFMSSAFDQEVVLVLGGCHDQSCEPLPGLQSLNFLAFSKTDGSEAFWSEKIASGRAPSAIWHHVCGSFAKGKQVVVFGGDLPESDPEFEEIRDRSQALLVYLLDVDACIWERVQTTGLHPSWRSLHTGIVHSSFKGARERLVIFGGCAEHTEIFSSGDVVDMCAYALDLQSFSWLRGPGQSPFHELPPGRMRVAAEQFGRFILINGGHGEEEINLPMLKLDLLTLSWSEATSMKPSFEGSHFAGSTLAGGILFGGVQMSSGRRGARVRIAPRLDVLHLEMPQDTPRSRDQPSLRTLHG